MKYLWEFKNPLTFYSALAGLLSDNDGPEESLLKNDKEKLLLEKVGQLSLKQKEVLMLFEFSELSYDEIAKTFDISMGTVKSRLFSARENLSMLVRGEDEN